MLKNRIKRGCDIAKYQGKENQIEVNIRFEMIKEWSLIEKMDNTRKRS